MHTQDTEHYLAYLQSRHVLTLCCQHESELWAANCFYLFDAEHYQFWLMTEPDSRHGRLMTANPQVAGTISDQILSVSELRGIQFSGIISLASGKALQHGLSAYQNHFPIARKKVAPLWVLRVDQLKMTDNRLGFGTKLYWQREKNSI